MSHGRAVGPAIKSGPQSINPPPNTQNSPKSPSEHTHLGGVVYRDLYSGSNHINSLNTLQDGVRFNSLNTPSWEGWSIVTFILVQLLDGWVGDCGGDCDNLKGIMGGPNSIMHALACACMLMHAQR